MEQNQPNPGTSLFQLNLDAANSYTLRSAASWAKVLGIVGIIIGILFFGIGLLVQSAISSSGYGDVITEVVLAAATACSPMPG